MSALNRIKHKLALLDKALSELDAKLLTLEEGSI